MIGRLSGKVSELGSDYVVVDVGGVGYIVFCSSKIICKYNVNDEIELITQTIVKENDISIFGFATNIDKEFFNHLLTIQGVGAKLAQTVIGGLTIDEIIEAVQTEDDSKFTRINGVGPKLAARLVNELKSKKFISKLQMIKSKTDIEKIVGVEPMPKILDAKSVLVNLGYNNIKINHVIHEIISMHGDIDLEELIKLGIKKLSA
ncbi:Holliday junction branch migration protein RuvA [Candidatus Bandiella euplotis]|uniref:Holliday junction branch migration complex subunit RuvA n=1 Tax=Candidatus Bandiella euplotis TaxID=1664265 RepID=A0ABZ0UL38_9RICK|nr:Holliday junction branch migration protein RuvA [Candidatus Bandiella woodruffii]WPX96439.1 Holliday junction ATP-dependent DNA helicase RuvA [Candidatus Bandiella woodruffii]